MGIRETINRHSAISTTVVIFAIGIGVVAIGMELKGESGKPPAKNFYTTDDGQTWFVDSSTKLPPFDHGGGTAVRCYVFKGSNGKFAGLLEKYSDATRAQLEKLGDQLPPFGTPVLVKKPGDKDWKPTSAEGEAVMLLKTSDPDGSAAERIMP